MKNTYKKQNFTLLEMAIYITVFTIILIISLNLYKTVTSIGKDSIEITEMYNNARIALELISRDIESIYYCNGEVAFWHWKPDNKPATWIEYRNELIAFISQTKLANNNQTTSTIVKIKYQKYYSTSHTSDHDKEYDGWLRRSATGNLNFSGQYNPKWANYYLNYKVGYKGENAVFTANSSS